MLGLIIIRATFKAALYTNINGFPVTLPALPHICEATERLQYCSKVTCIPYLWVPAVHTMQIREFESVFHMRTSRAKAPQCTRQALARE